MLADWPLGGAAYQQALKPDGTKMDYAEFVVPRPNGTSQRVTLESPSTIGFPGAGDKDFMIALINMGRDDGFQTDIVHFIPSHVLRFVGLAETSKNYQRLKTALKRLRALTITYERTWYSRKTRTVEPSLVTGILAEAKIVLRRGRRQKNAVPDSYVQWTQNFHRSLQEGNLTDLNLDLYFAWTRPCCKDLHRHLNKVWHAGRRPKVYERDLCDIACGHLGMTESKYLKRNFQNLIEEMEEGGYLLPLNESIRYQKVRPGVWRVRFELHPDQIRSTRAGRGDSSHEGNHRTEAARLVCEYHRHRFAQTQHHPSPSEIRHAQALLHAYDADHLFAAIPDVARTIANQSGGDLYFGYAVPLLRSAVEARLKQSKAAQYHQAREDQFAAQQQTIRAEQQRRNHRRVELLNQWHSLSQRERQRHLQRAIEEAPSAISRRRLQRADLAEPPTEVLDLIASEPAAAMGE